MSSEEENKKLKKETRNIDKLIRDIHKHLVQYTKKHLKHNGLTIPRFSVLWHIKKSQPVNMSFLHKKMYMANSTLTIIVDKLVDKELVKRYRNPDDRRVVLLELTESGNKLLCKMLNIRQRFLQQAITELDSDKQQVLMELLGTILNNLENSLHKGNKLDE